MTSLFNHTLPLTKVWALFLILFISLPYFGFSQDVQEDVVYLKDGSIIRGQIVEHIIGERIKVELLGGSVLVYEESKVEKITREPVRYQPLQVKPTKIPRRQRPITYRNKGNFYNLFSFGLAFGEGNWGVDVQPSLTYRAGIHLHQYLNLGVGVGIDGYQEGGIMPIFLDVHGDIGKPGSMMPHYFLNGGYGAAVANGWNTRVFEGGAMLYGGLGWKLNTRRKAEWMFTIGYKMQNTYQETEIWNGGGIGIEPGIAQGTRQYRRVMVQATFGF